MSIEVQENQPKFREILMFVCLQKDSEQHCDATKRDHTLCAGQGLSLIGMHIGLRPMENTGFVPWFDTRME